MLSAIALALLQDPAPPAQIAYKDLLAQLYDLRFLTQPPAAGERAVQFSSWDRASQAGPGNAEAWYANNDAGQYLRVEAGRQPDGKERKEFVMVDTDGPGVVTRIWSANPNGDLLFYVDGAATPALSVPFQDLCRGDHEPFLAPLCGEQSRGWNCYVPLPFARHLKISATSGDFYYQVDVRLLPPGTEVPSLSVALLQDQLPAIKDTCHVLADQAPPYRPDRHGNIVGMIKPGKTLEHWVNGEGTVRELWVQFLQLATVKDMPAMLRSLRLQIVTGDAPAPLVDCPLGDFFGAAPGLEPYTTWAMGMKEDGRLYCRLPMTYRDGFRVRLTNEGTEQVNMRLEVWTDVTRSGPLTLHAAWKQERDMGTRPRRDYRMLEAQGPGRYVGCSLSVRNPVREWWGEGDEKFFVDGETFPSTFGTGTEDYFGYAWCCPEPFSHPFHAQPRCDGPGNYGFTSVNRFQLGDQVPFQKSFVFDLEVWHWSETAKVDYASVAYWYAAPDATSAMPPLAPVAERLPRPLPEYPYYRVPGAIEAESLQMSGLTRGQANPQDMSGFGDQWSGEKQLWWTGAAAGETMILILPVAANGRYELKAQFTKAPDYGIVSLLLDGKALGAPIDLYSTKVEPAVLTLGTLDLTAGDHRLALRIQGKNEQAKPGYMVGLDYFLLQPADGAQADPPESAAVKDSFYALNAPSLEGDPVALSKYAGKVALVVNVASECGYTPQYTGLEQLYEELAPQGFVLLGFPSNEFGGQEPGSPAEIRKFCTDNYRVSFPLFSKVETKPGPSQSPVYGFLTRDGAAPSWNFCKYLIGKDGRVLQFFPSKVAPDAPELRQAIAAALAQ